MCSGTFPEAAAQALVLVGIGVHSEGLGWLSTAPDFWPLRLIENDIIIVSSDGVTDSMPLNRIVNHIHFDQNADGIARMIKYGVRSRKNPRQDNYSAIVIKMKRSFV